MTTSSPAECERFPFGLLFTAVDLPRIRLTLAASPDGKDLYIAYLKRPWHGRRNNEVFVERWMGSGWQPMGGTLNINGQDKDAWSYRPCIVVNSKGVPYVAWNEHVNSG